VGGVIVFIDVDTTLSPSSLLSHQDLDDDDASDGEYDDDDVDRPVDSGVNSDDGYVNVDESFDVASVAFLLPSTQSGEEVDDVDDVVDLLFPIPRIDTTL